MIVGALGALAASAATKGLFGDKQQPEPSFGKKVTDGLVDAAAQVPGQVVGATVGSRLAGRGQKNYMDAAFPGSNTFDRLGGAAGAGQMAGMGAPERIAKINARTSKYVADKQAAASMYSADSHVKAAELSSEESRGRYREQAGAYRDKIDWETLRDRSISGVNKAKEMLLSFGFKEAEEREKLAELFVKWDLRESEMRAISNGIRGASDALGAARSLIPKVTNGRRSARPSSKPLGSMNQKEYKDYLKWSQDTGKGESMDSLEEYMRR
jgi:hypothetical protein